MPNKQHTLREMLPLMERHLRTAKQDKYGVIKCEKRGLFSVRITPGLIDRTLAFIERVAGTAAERG